MAFLCKCGENHRRLLPRVGTVRGDPARRAHSSRRPQGAERPPLRRGAADYATRGGRGRCSAAEVEADSRKASSSTSLWRSTVVPFSNTRKPKSSRMSSASRRRTAPRGSTASSFSADRLDQPLNLSFRLAEGGAISSVVRRRTNRGGYFPETPIPAEFKMLPGNIAYLRVQIRRRRRGGRVPAPEHRDGRATKRPHHRHPAQRRGQRSIVWAVLAILGNRPFPDRIGDRAITSRRCAHGTRPPAGSGTPTGRQQFDSATHYTSPVVVLTSGTTYSSAEQFVTGIRIMRRGTIVGEATGGSLSNPMVFQLPGGGMGFIGSKDDYYPDGQLFNGIGIMPDVSVSPTIADIRAGRDRALEKAVEMLKVKH